MSGAPQSLAALELLSEHASFGGMQHQYVDALRPPRASMRGLCESLRPAGHTMPDYCQLPHPHLLAPAVHHREV